MAAALFARSLGRRVAWARPAAVVWAPAARPARRLFATDVMDDSVDAIAGLTDEQVQVRRRERRRVGV
jgi:hypothetical protein